MKIIEEVHYRDPNQLHMSSWKQIRLVQKDGKLQMLYVCTKCGKTLVAPLNAELVDSRH